MFKYFNVQLLDHTRSIVKSFFSTTRSLAKGNLIDIQKDYTPKVHPNCSKVVELFLPKSYETMMQVVLPRIAERKKIHRMSLDIRRARFSLEARLKTAEGRRIVLRRILNGRNPPTPFHE